jgi:ABC-type bacteriocin transporter
MKRYFQKYTCVKQHDEKDCGAACLATIAKHYGLALSVSKIREMAGTDLQGTSAYGVIQAAEKLGFTAKGVKGDAEAFYSEFPLPAIAHVVVNGNFLHYVVIHAIDKEKVIVADPGKGLVTYTPEEFFKEWTGVLILMTPVSTFEKGDQTKGLFQRFFYLIKPQKKLLVHIFFASILYTLLGVLGAFYFKVLMDDIVPYGLIGTLHIISIGIICLGIFKIILSVFRSYMLAHLSIRIDIPLILGYYDHVLRLPMNFFGTRKTGEILSRFSDAGNIREAISGVTLTVMIDTIMAVVGGILLYISNPTLFAIALAMVVLYGITVILFNKPYRTLNQKLMEQGAQLNSYLYESVNGIDTLKAFRAEQEASDKTEKLYVKQTKEGLKLMKLNFMRSSLTGTIGLVGGTLILWVGAYKVIKGELTLGQLMVFNSLLAYFVEPVSNLINLQPTMQTAIVAADRLGEILDLELEQTEIEGKKMKPLDLKGDIRIENLEFRYGTRALTLKDINLHIKKGERVAFVGESGSGKTTLARLMLQYYQLEKGDIYVSDNNIKDVQMATLRDKIAYVHQETFLFSGSIMENMTLGNADLTMDEVVEACKLAKAHEFISEMPLRYESRLEENGSNLSGGQRQRLAIARALLKSPDILIMDEATSNLDTVTERALQSTIETIGREMTVILIAHRLSTIKNCDRIFVFEKGEIIEFGTHEELLKNNGRYFQMWDGQFETDSVATEKMTEVTA